METMSTCRLNVQIYKTNNIKILKKALTTNIFGAKQCLIDQSANSAPLWCQLKTTDYKAAYSLKVTMRHFTDIYGTAAVPSKII